MSNIILKLQDLSCQHCVKNVTKTLEAIAGVEAAVVSLNYAKVSGEVEAQTLINAIVNAGYQAQVATQPDLLLALGGLSCGHCVKNTEKALSAVENVEVFEVTKTEAKIYGKADANAVIKAIVDAGYEATLAGGESPKSNLLSEVSSVKATVQNPDPVIVENNDEDQVVLLLDGLSCAACVLKVERALQAVPKVKSARVNLAEQTALVFGEAEPHSLVDAVIQAGYGAQAIDNEEERREKQVQQNKAEIILRQRQAILALVVGFAVLAFALMGDKVMLTAKSQSSWLWIALITLATMIYSGGHFYQRAWRSLLNKTSTMDTLVSLGTGVAWLYSLFVTLNYDFFPESARHVYFEASTMLIGFINLGKMLEARAKQKSSQALQRLLDLTPATARVVEAGGEREIPLAEVKQGMVLRLQTGDRVSVDGRVVEGNAWLDESMLTGEPLPVEKALNDKVSAGTLVTDGTLLFVAEQVGRHTTLASIIRLVRQAQSSKPQIGQLVDKIASVFVPVVVGIAIISALCWYFIGPEPKLAYSLVVFTTVLIIACPCSLGLAVPMSIIAGVGRLAEFGVLVRDADALQKAAKVDTIVFDKTGTLTQGKPKVTALYTFNDYSEQSAVQFAAILEQGASHPLAKAILSFAQERQIHLSTPQQFRTLKGLGVAGEIEGKQVLLGNQTLLQQQGIATECATELMLCEAQKGATTVLLAVEQQLVAMFAIRDPLREESIAAVQRLRHQGYHLVMLTGDQESTAQAIAKELGLDQVIAGVLPEGKAQAIVNLQQQGRQVMMVGDGINDAPALAQANVSMAMGEGSDIAIEIADLSLMRQNMGAVADALSLSKGILRNMKENLFGAFIYNGLGIPIAAGVLYPFLGVLLNPIFAGIAMALSSITVATNANRLLWFKPKS